MIILHGRQLQILCDIATDRNKTSTVGPLCDIVTDVTTAPDIV